VPHQHTRTGNRRILLVANERADRNRTTQSKNVRAILQLFLGIRLPSDFQRLGVDMGRVMRADAQSGQRLQRR
jgi:hypothetical protein